MTLFAVRLANQIGQASLIVVGNMHQMASACTVGSLWAEAEISTWQTSAVGAMHTFALYREVSQQIQNNP